MVNAGGWSGATVIEKMDESGTIYIQYTVEETDKSWNYKSKR